MDINTNINRTKSLLAYLTILRLKSEVESLSFLIDLTDTSDKRNELCDANIHLRESINYLENYRKSFK